MVFSSNIFIFGFLPFALLGNFLFKNRLRNIFVLIVSLLFYAWGEPVCVLVLIFSTIFNYIICIGIDKFRKNKPIFKLLFFSAISINLGILIVYKYSNFIISNVNTILKTNISPVEIILPIGISFFTFQAISYVVDVYREKVPVQKNIVNLGVYMSFFSKVTSGPIVGYSKMLDELEDRKVNFDDVSIGVKRFIIGLGKKVLIANSIALVADKAFSSVGVMPLSVSFAWLGAISYSLQLFFDFAGYSDMAIGLGQMFGFHFSENFNYPYISKSISEFWRRWHISLGSWFREYVYIPLGGSRVSGKWRLILNLFVVWILTGIWHGASWTFIWWGMIHFSVIAFEKLTGLPDKFNNKFFGLIYRGFTLFTVVIGWTLFRSNGIEKARYYIYSMFGKTNNEFFDSKTFFWINEYKVAFLMAILFSIPIVPYFNKIIMKNSISCRIYKITMPLIYIVLFMVIIAAMVVNTYNPFIYFNF